MKKLKPQKSVLKTHTFIYQISMVLSGSKTFISGFCSWFYS